MEIFIIIPRSLEHNAVNRPRAGRTGHPRALFFIVIPGLRPGDPSFKVLCHLQIPPEHRGLCSTILITDRSGRRLWIAGSSPAMTVSCTIFHLARLGCPLRMA